LKKQFLFGVLATFSFTTGALAADIAFIGGKPDDLYWGVAIKKGVDDARFVVEANGGKVVHFQLQTYENMGVDAAGLIRTAIGQGFDGIVTPNFVPDAQDDTIKAAISAGIKVMLLDSGSLEKAEELGAINYIGYDPYVGGVVAGDYFGKNGQKNILCINTLPGVAVLEAMCKGLNDGITELGGMSRTLPLPASSWGDQVAVSEAIKATLLKDATIDAVFTVSVADGDAAAIAISQANKIETVKLASFSLSASVGERIKDGTQLFSVDLNPYLQAFLAVTLLASHLDFGVDLPVRPLPTGPVIVNATNIEAAIVGVTKGAR